MWEEHLSHEQFNLKSDFACPCRLSTDIHLAWSSTKVFHSCDNLRPQGIAERMLRYSCSSQLHLTCALQFWWCSSSRKIALCLVHCGDSSLMWMPSAVLQCLSLSNSSYLQNSIPASAHPASLLFAHVRDVCCVEGKRSLLDLLRHGHFYSDRGWVRCSGHQLIDRSDEVQECDPGRKLRHMLHCSFASSNGSETDFHSLIPFESTMSRVCEASRLIATAAGLWYHGTTRKYAIL